MLLSLLGAHGGGYWTCAVLPRIDWNENDIKGREDSNSFKSQPTVRSMELDHGVSVNRPC
jgi:hypothetical protein